MWPMIVMTSMLPPQPAQNNANNNVQNNAKRLSHKTATTKRAGGG